MQKNTCINERTQKSGELSNLNAARKKYVAEFNKRVKTDKIKKDGDKWREGKSPIAAFDVAIYDFKSYLLSQAERKLLQQ